VDIWNINSVESFAYEYDGYAPFYDDGPVPGQRPRPGRDRPGDRLTARSTCNCSSINDFHGRLESPARSTASRSAARPSSSGWSTSCAAANPNTAWVSAGDNIGASTFISAHRHGQPDDRRAERRWAGRLRGRQPRVRQGPRRPAGRVDDRAEFPLLAANVYKDDKRVLPGYSVQNLGGVRVGYIGVVTEQTGSLVSPDGIAGVQFRDPVAEANKLAGELSDGNERNGEADVLVLLAHEVPPPRTSVPRPSGGRPGLR
jgi:5'-nucleotidase